MPGKWVEFRGVCVEIDMIPIKGDELAHSEAGIREQRDDRLVAPLEVDEESVGETGVANLLDLFRGELGRGLFLMSA